MWLPVLEWIHPNASTRHVVKQHQRVTFLSLSGFKTCGAQVHERAELASFGCRSRWADVRRSELLGGSCWPEASLDLIQLERWVRMVKINQQRELESKFNVLSVIKPFDILPHFSWLWNQLLGCTLTECLAPTVSQCLHCVSHHPLKDKEL